MLTPKYLLLGMQTKRNRRNDAKARRPNKQTDMVLMVAYLQLRFGELIDALQLEIRHQSIQHVLNENDGGT